MKKVLAVLLCMVVCFSSVNVLAYFDYPDVSEEYVKITDLLYDLEIMEGDDEENFKPDDTLTRAEAAAIMVRLMGLEYEVIQSETNFEDVDLNHWASGYINVAEENGIVNGMGDGRFNPEGEVTYHQFVKMLVCILGYEPVAEANGGWLGGGYLYAGSKAGFTKGIDGKVTDVITRMTAARLVYNSLEVELIDENAFSTGINGMTSCFPDYDDKTTILSLFLDCELIVGVVKSSDESQIEVTFTKDSKSYNKGDVIRLENKYRYINDIEEKTVTAWIELGDEKNIFLIGEERK